MGSCARTFSDDETQLAAGKVAPRLGPWDADEKAKTPNDSAALAMWMHPNEPTYVRERMIALVKGPFPPSKGAPVARVWLANLGDVINRLGALGEFTMEDCLAVGAKWTAKPDANGQFINHFAPPSARDEEEARATARAAEWKPLQSPWDGHLLADRERPEETLNDPDSLEHDKCTTPRKDGNALGSRSARTVRRRNSAGWSKRQSATT